MHGDPYAWSADAETLLLVPGLAVAYAVAARIYPSARWRPLAFAGGLALVVAAFVSPLETLSLHYLLSAHLLQNVVLAEWAPALCVLAISPDVAGRLAALPAVRRLTTPLVALPLWL